MAGGRGLCHSGHVTVDVYIEAGRAGGGPEGVILVAEAIKRIRWVGSSPPIAD